MDFSIWFLLTVAKVFISKLCRINSQKHKCIILLTPQNWDPTGIAIPTRSHKSFIAFKLQNFIYISYYVLVRDLSQWAINNKRLADFELISMLNYYTERGVLLAKLIESPCTERRHGGMRGLLLITSSYSIITTEDYTHTYQLSFTSAKQMFFLCFFLQ